MQQKTAIALALLRETSILLLDESTSGLDPVAIDEFHDLVKALASSGQTILMVTARLLAKTPASGDLIRKLTLWRK